MKKKMTIRDTDEYKHMNPMTACACVEGICGWEESTEGERAAAWQYIYDNHLEYQMPGFYGRTIRDLLESGMLES